ncbi:putative protein transport membrane glycoprotein Sec20 [Aspergillus puulaauensis]|uniref:Sec20 C-terminal domain-containing protein n=1 Tax=Aspergillus puulaauensis TaxID=1220207 RepID=A0A7R7XJ33_9EURO|nr:uncharacterized protein APUU_30566A [Aspergillus puulaauensis]BCS22341.1 hypothetical protein APUU_30566A [Aspergillus puulaauensis]
MSTISVLQTRLKELSAALTQIQPLVSRLHTFSVTVGQGDEARLELGGEIHSRLKDAEDELELLKDDVDALETQTDSRRKGMDSEKETEKERAVALARRLANDLKKTRGDFRNAQLQAKRNAEVARRKERELLLSRSDSVERRNPAKEKLTQDDIVKNASQDVTTALRRTHHLMQAELSRSQFAQETLEQSGAALSSLSESYTSLDTLLSSSRNLVGSLLRSQKSDTWYLETAFYILIGTISWLVFRRLLYGPLWWVVWMPFKLILRVVFGLSGAVGITSKAVESSATTSTTDMLIQETPALSHVPEAKAHGAGRDNVPDQVPGMESADRDWIIDKIGEIVEDNVEQANLDDFTSEELQGEAEIPSNTKKRMFEATPEAVQRPRDEL